MPVLSFPCTIVPRDPSLRKAPFRMFWIKGSDLRAPALASTKLLKATPDDCGYALYATAPHVYLEVVRDSPHARAIVGPMSGPIPPSILSRARCYSLEELIAHVQVADGPRAEGASAVIVKHAGIFGDGSYPLPHRRKGEPKAEYAKRAAPMEQVRLTRAQHEGIHVIHYDVLPDLWRAADLDMLMALTYRALPIQRPFHGLPEDPISRRSHESLYLQLADLIVYAAFRRVFPPPARSVQIVPESMWDELGDARCRSERLAMSLSRIVENRTVGVVTRFRARMCRTAQVNNPAIRHHGAAHHGSRDELDTSRGVGETRSPTHTR